MTKQNQLIPSLRLTNLCLILYLKNHILNLLSEWFHSFFKLSVKLFWTPLQSHKSHFPRPSMQDSCVLNVYLLTVTVNGSGIILVFMESFAIPLALVMPDTVSGSISISTFTSFAGVPSGFKTSVWREKSETVRKSKIYLKYVLQQSNVDEMELQCSEQYYKNNNITIELRFI